MAHKDVITIDDISVPAVIGILPEERVNAQPVIVSGRLSLDTTEAARLGEINETIDYAAWARATAFILETGQFGLLESAAMTLLAFSLAPSPLGEKAAHVLEASITLTKPAALKGRGTPSVTLTRSRHDFKAAMAPHAGGLVETLYVCRDVTLLRFSAKAGTPLPGAWPTSRALAGEMSLGGTSRLVLLRP